MAAGLGPRRDSGLEKRDLTHSMALDEERRLAEEIPRIVEEIRLRHSRRMRRAPRGRVWMKRAIRENLSTGGVPFRLPARAPGRKRPRVVLLVDVSRSVARAAGLFLMIAVEFLKLGRGARVFLFVNHPVEGTEALRRWLMPGYRARPAEARGRATPPRLFERPIGSVEPSWFPPSDLRSNVKNRWRSAGAGVVSRASGRSFLDLLDRVPGLDPDAASDYGRTFYALASGPLRSPGGRDAILVVLGDGRTNVFDPLPWAFEELAGRARRVIWLAPEPRARWGSGDSALPQYLAFCDVAVEVRDLEGLAHGVREIVGSM